MRTLHSIQPEFKVWIRCKDMGGHSFTFRNVDIPQQPAVVWEQKGNKLLLGDVSEWFHKSSTCNGVRTIINLCPEMVCQDSTYYQRATELNVLLVSIPAQDNKTYDIISEACPDEFLDFIHHRLQLGSVLVTCWAGCNRSAAVVLATMVLKYNVDIIDAFRLISKQRGQILTNYHFRLLLVKAFLTQQDKKSNQSQTLSCAV